MQARSIVFGKWERADLSKISRKAKKKRFKKRFLANPCPRWWGEGSEMPNISIFRLILYISLYFCTYLSGERENSQYTQFLYVKRKMMCCQKSGRQVPPPPPCCCYVLVNVANVKIKCNTYFYKMCNLQLHLQSGHKGNFPIRCGCTAKYYFHFPDIQHHSYELVLFLAQRVDHTKS